MRTKKFGIVLLSVVSILASTVVLAQHGPVFHKMRGPGGIGMAQALAERLDLNEEQKASVKTFVEQLHSETAPFREQTRTLHEEIQKELASGNPDATAIGERVIAAHQIRERMKAAHEAFKERLGTILDEEQKKELQEMHEMHTVRFVEHAPVPHFGFIH